MFKSVRHIFSFSSVLLLSKLLTVSVSYFLALLVSDVEFGYYSLAQSLYVTMILLLGFSGASAFVRYYPDYGFHSVFSALKLLYTLLFVFSLVLGLFFFYYFRDSPLKWFSLLPFASFVGAWSINFGAISRCRNDVLWYSVSELSRPMVVAVFFCLYYYGVMIGDHFFVFYLYGLVLSGLLVVMYGFNRAGALNKKDSGELLSRSKVIFYLIPLVIAHASSLSNNVADKYILAAYFGMSELGFYSKAYLIGSSVGMLMESFSLLWFPYVVKNRFRFFNDLYGKVMLVVFLLSLLSIVVLLSAVVAFSLKWSVWGVDFRFITVTLIIVSAFLARGGYQVFVPVLSAFDQTSKVAYISIFCALLGLLANLLLIPRLGLYGAAIATWLSFSLYSLISLYFVRKLANIK